MTSVWTKRPIKHFTGIATAILLGMGTIGATITGTIGAQAFPAGAVIDSLKVQKDLSEGRGQPAGSTSDAEQVRPPLLIRVGARQQLFDGEFLCDMQDREPMLDGLFSDR